MHIAELLLPALTAGLLVALIAGPMGCLVIWRRMAFFGDTLAHGALLGAAGGLVLGVAIYPAVVVFSLLLALLLVSLQQQRQIANDTLLAIVAHSTLALGIMAISLGGVQVDLFAFLFGDLLAVTWADVLWLAGGALLLMGLLWYFWRQLLSMTLNEDLAQVEGVQVNAVRILLMLMLALLIAGAIRTVGVLLITSLLIIPAAAARRLSRTPESMAILSSLLGCAAVVWGLVLSWHLDAPVGPSIVVAAAALFALILLLPARSS